jgi:hypothetical protein
LFVFSSNFRNLARGKKEKEGAKFPKVQRLFMGKILCPSPQIAREKHLNLNSPYLENRFQQIAKLQEES